MASKTKTVEVTLSVKAIVREGMDIKKLLEEETEFMAEPKSTNGCVTAIKIKKIS